MNSSVVFDESLVGFEESMMKRSIYTDQHHSEFAFHRFSLLREKNILTDAVILSSDDKRCANTSKQHTTDQSKFLPHLFFGFIRQKKNFFRLIWYVFSFLINLN